MLRKTLTYLFNKYGSAYIFGTDAQKIARWIPYFKGVPTSGMKQFSLPFYEGELDILLPTNRPYAQLLFGKKAVVITFGCVFTKSGGDLYNIDKDVTELTEQLDYSVGYMVNKWNEVCRYHKKQGLLFLFDRVDYELEDNEDRNTYELKVNIVLTYSKITLV